MNQEEDYDVAKILRKKMEEFNQNKELVHYAKQRELRKQIVEGEKRLMYEGGLEEGKTNEKLKDVQAVIETLYSVTHLDWLNNYTYEQLDIIFNQAFIRFL